MFRLGRHLQGLIYCCLLGCDLPEDGDQLQHVAAK